MMNELIKELVFKSGLIQYASDSKLEDAEKFAKLIVRECCDQLIKQGEGWHEFAKNPPQGQENHAAAALFAAYRLKDDAVAMLEEHFGVE